MSNEDDRKRRLRALFSPESLRTLRQRAERLALLHLDSGTSLSDESVEVMAAMHVFSLSCNIPELQNGEQRYHDVLRGLELFNAMRAAPAPAPLQMLCNECGQRLPHESACGASTDPEACS